MLGERLRIARKKAGYSLRGLAEVMNPPVSAQAISKYEANEMMPSSGVLLGLGQALGVSLDFLMSSNVEELQGIEFRKHSGTSARDRARVEAIVTEELERYLAIEDILELAPAGDPFADIRCDGVSSYDEAEALADKLRKQWRLGLDPIPSMIGLLEECGVKVIVAAFPDNVSGLTCTVKRSGDRPDTEAIVISEKINVERKRFTLAHELAHRVIRGVKGKDIKLETAMNRFAGAFLVPAAHLRREVGNHRRGIAYHEIIQLKRFYGVSAAALLVRLGNAGILPDNAVTYAFRTFARRWRTDEPEPIQDDVGLGAFEHPERFQSLVYRALAEELISPARAAQLLKRPLAAIEEGIRGPRGA
ncbi:transcriptional regulator [Devosia pacifica]|uniref:Transcriptional regulator n=1 Tax=Devosia pacifica TaxID=1335967 RepID=A0A918S2E4_9HYPH|nr:XRE family transcriptional regulator [Devosia pacifica]GHA20439.1 transcriptional regulator [Devosia pacifica]